MHNATKIALCGKGGVGKTSISAVMVKLLSADRTQKVLAIDADPAFGLAVALGVEIHKTVDDIRKNLITRIQKHEETSMSRTLKHLDYELFEALHEQDGFAMLAIGRPEDEGCFCRVNDLLKVILADLADNFDVVVIDGEAGVEQINRRVMKTVDYLFLVSDTSAKGIGVVQSIAHVAADNEAVDYKSMGIILNRVRKQDEVDTIRSRTELPIYGWIADDEAIRDFDFEGRSLRELPESSPTVDAVQAILQGTGLK